MRMTVRASSLVRTVGSRLGALGADGVDGVVEVLLEDLAVEEQDSVKSLVLCRGGYFALHSQVGEEGFDLRGAHVPWVPLVVEQDEAFDPPDIGVFGADGVMLAADRIADLIEQCVGTSRHRRPPVVLTRSGFGVHYGQRRGGITHMAHYAELYPDSKSARGAT
jgi:hypothetical protein